MTDATSIFCTLVGLAINVLQFGIAYAIVLGFGGACQATESFPKSWTVHCQD